VTALGVLVLALGPAAASADGVVPVDRGAFGMGSDADGPTEAPAHGLYLEQFYEHRGTAPGHHHVGFRCATSENLSPRAKPVVEGDRR